MVSRTWRANALPLLFRFVKVLIDEPQRSLDRFCSVLRASPALALCIRTLSIAGSANFDLRIVTGSRSVLRPEDLAAVLENLPDLDELWVMFCRVPDSTEPLHPLRNLLSLKKVRLRRLVFSGWKLHGGIAAVLWLLSAVDTLVFEYVLPDGVSAATVHNQLPDPLPVKTLHVHVRSQDNPEAQVALLSAFGILSSMKTLVLTASSPRDVVAAAAFIPQDSPQLRAALVDMTPLRGTMFRWDRGGTCGVWTLSHRDEEKVRAHAVSLTADRARAVLAVLRSALSRCPALHRLTLRLTPRALSQPAARTSLGWVCDLRVQHLVVELCLCGSKRTRLESETWAVIAQLCEHMRVAFVCDNAEWSGLEFEDADRALADPGLVRRLCKLRDTRALTIGWEQSCAEYGCEG